MTKVKKSAVSTLLILAALALCLVFHAAPAHASEYTRSATLNPASSAYPGVYFVKAEPEDAGNPNATIGIPSLDKNALNAPTTESPAIIMGAAVPYEVKTGPTSYTPRPGGTLYPPYSYFRYSIINEQGADGTWHQKMSGFDGSYFLIRVDVSDLIKDAPAGSYLHVKQEGNKALMASLLYEKYDAALGKGSFSEAMGNKAAVYAIDKGGVSMKDKTGSDTGIPYVDVIVYSSGTHVAGAETGSATAAQNADFKLKFYIDQTADYNPALDYDPNNQSTGTPTHADQVMAKFYDETKVSSDKVISYTVKGNDLEIEIIHPGPNGGAAEFWSLRKAMGWYDNSPIKMICEVPVLEGLLINGGRHVIFDVNSFDIQIANHQTTGAAALTVENGTLTIMDGFNTTGAELAVGNNARMYIGSGGKLIIDETCQVEVEYDAASVVPAQDGTVTPVTYDVGLITIASGGEIENNGVISIEGTEGKPIDPANPAIRDMKAAELHIEAGGKLTNNGALVAYGGLYNLGTLVNNGHYNETITSNDPDKGRFTYHKGIQIAWKDDVTQSGVRMGYFSNGAEGQTSASFLNNGDLVLAPGFLENYGTLENTASGNLYLCAVDEAVIPVQVPWSALIMEQRVGFERPMAVYFTNYAGAALTNAGKIASAQVEIVGNGNLGTLTQVVPTDLAYDICVDNFGDFNNSGSISLNALYNFAGMSNSGSIANKIVLEGNQQTEGSLTDTAGLTDIYNGAKTENGGTNTWTRVACAKLSVSPSVQYSMGRQTVNWTVKAETQDPGAQGVRYYLLVLQGNGDTPKAAHTIRANEDNTITSPEMPWMNGNALYHFRLMDGLFSVHAEATVKVTSSGITPPAGIPELVYNGKEQTLISSGAVTDGTLLYRLGETGQWSEKLPAAKDAGSYKVYFKRSGDSEDANQLFAEATIAKKPVTVSGADAASQLNAELAALSYTVSGLVEGETLNGVTVSTDAKKDTVGEYKVSVTVSGENPNYAVTTREGKYTVTADAFVVVAKDKYGVFSDETSYTGFNIELTVPQGATAYYSTAKPLTRDNYQTDGMTALKNQPSTAGTHTVYFYVTDGTNAVSGSKQVIIDKATQTSPDAAKLFTRGETRRNSLDGIIGGLTARKMEYRSKANDGSYTLAYLENVYVEPGVYLVRMAADENHYASPDTEVAVAEGPFITVYFALNGSKDTLEDATGLSCGDLLPRPKTDPTMPDAVFLGWYSKGKPYDFNTPLGFDTTLTAAWAPKTIDFKLPAGITRIEDSAFESVPAKSIEIPASCQWVYPDAFKGDTALKQLRILSADTRFTPTAFSGCKDVYIFAPGESAARYLCTEENGFIFVETFS